MRLVAAKQDEVVSAWPLQESAFRRTGRKGTAKPWFTRPNAQMKVEVHIHRLLRIAGSKASSNATGIGCGLDRVPKRSQSVLSPHETGHKLAMKFLIRHELKRGYRINASHHGINASCLWSAPIRVCHWQEVPVPLTRRNPESLPCRVSA